MSPRKCVASLTRLGIRFRHVEQEKKPAAQRKVRLLD